MAQSCCGEIHDFIYIKYLEQCLAQNKPWTRGCYQNHTTFCDIHYINLPCQWHEGHSYYCATTATVHLHNLFITPTEALSCYTLTPHSLLSPAPGKLYSTAPTITLDYIIFSLFNINLLTPYFVPGTEVESRDTVVLMMDSLSIHGSCIPVGWDCNKQTNTLRQTGTLLLRKIMQNLGTGERIQCCVLSKSDLGFV